MEPVIFAWICIFSPLAGAALTPLLGRINAKLRDVGAVLFALVAAGCALRLLPLFWSPEALPIESSFTWLEAPIEIGFGILIDPVTLIVMNVVAVISSIIMVYCVGYMKDDPGRGRFWMWMNSFIGSMLLLVLSNNLLFLFVGWKLVGVCSYGLIGYYYKDERKYWIGGPEPSPFVKPSQANLKALVVTGFGDMAMLGGILIMFYYAGTLNLLQLYETLPTWMPQIADEPGMVLLLGVLLLAGPVGKSAQFPFHEWLPEAMAGPGPVSALIHAATMVKSGVYLVARLLPIFYYGHWVVGSDEALTFFELTAWCGAITAFLAATQGMVALELKKVLAYSTVSQIGYMMLALGVAGMSPELVVNGVTSGIFHLTSHALFKACLFLCAGSVIHAVHSFYITDMGALRKVMPLTWLFTLIGSLSLMGMFPFPGFWSKDMVLLTVLEANVPLFAVGLVTAGLTAFYTMRFFGIVFHGEESANVAHAREGHGHLGEPHPTMWIACGILAVALVALGLGGLPAEHAIHAGMEHTITAQLQLPVEEAASHVPHWLVPALSIGVVLIGAILAYLMYFRRSISVPKLVAGNALVGGLQKFFWNRWYIDAFYNKVIVGGLTKLADVVAFGIEDNFDTAVHRKLPTLFTEKAYALVRQLRTENHAMVVTVSYVLAFFIFFLVVFLMVSGG